MAHVLPHTVHKCTAIHKGTHVYYVGTPRTLRTSQSTHEHTHAPRTYPNVRCVHTRIHNHTHSRGHHLCAIMPATHTAHTHVHHVCIHKYHVCTYEHTPTHSLHVPTCVSVMYVQDRHTRVLVHRHIPQVSTHVLRTHAHMNVSPHTYPHPRRVCKGACATDVHARAGGTMRMRVRAFHHTCTRAHRPHAVQRPASALCLLTNGTHRDAQPHTHSPRAGAHTDALCTYPHRHA